MTQIITSKQDELIVLNDLGLIGGIVNNGIPIEDLDRSHTRKIGFVFKNSIKLREIIKDYWSGNLFVNARTYFDDIKMIKNMIHSN